jgi:hypothetical protein
MPGANQAGVDEVVEPVVRAGALLDEFHLAGKAFFPFVLQSSNAVADSLFAACGVSKLVLCETRDLLPEPQSGYGKSSG